MKHVDFMPNYAKVPINKNDEFDDLALLTLDVDSSIRRIHSWVFFLFRTYFFFVPQFFFLNVCGFFC